MNHRIALSLSIATGLALVGCPAPSTPANDTGPVGVDMGTPAADVGTDAFVDAATQACIDATRAAGAHCSSDTERSCFFQHYEALCSTGVAAAITASMNCFTTTTCHTFADPGETTVETCLDGSYTAHTSTMATAALTSYCAVCTTSSACPASSSALGIPFEHLSDAQLGILKTCFDNTTDCTTADACITDGFSDLTSCFP